MSGATSARVFANTHTGLCNYPTRVGRMHNRLMGRDTLKGMIENLHTRGLDIIIYYCTIFTDWYYDNHPEARTVDDWFTGLVYLNDSNRWPLQTYLKQLILTFDTSELTKEDMERLRKIFGRSFKAAQILSRVLYLGR